MPDQRPVLQVAASMDGDPRKGAETGRDTKERSRTVAVSVVVGDMNAAGVGMEAGEDRVGESGGGYIGCQGHDHRQDGE